MSKRGLPLFSTKEDAQFKEALKLYESKQYKKSIKLLEQNLKKNSSHVESLALKGLVLYYLEDLAGAKQYVEKSISKGVNNPVANHIVAIYYRNTSDYTNAARWFKAALDNGSSNKNIARELSIVQSQIRDFKGLAASRLDYLDDQPGYRANWTATAVAHHLNKDYRAAEKVLARIEGLIEGKLGDSDLFENSECLLYKNQIIFESGEFEKGLKNLEYIESTVFDQLSVLEMKAKYLINLDRHKEASLIYRKLLKRNPDNKDYYLGLEKALQIDGADVPKRLALYDKLATFYPRSDPVKFIPLQFLTKGSDLESRLSDYVVSALKRGVPSIFVNVKPLYRSDDKKSLIESIVLKFLADEAASYSPLTYCWTNYFLAQHYLHEGQLAKAHQYIDTALQHTPTLVELYIVKARILKHENKLDEAASMMNEGRVLDLQDRFINSKATKYYLRAGKIDEAADTISMFTKSDKEAANGVKDLHMMQCCWFIVESAEAYFRLYKEASVGDDREEARNFKALALKRFNAIDKIYQEYWNDQVDFHSYCMRKGTPRHYIDMLQWADNLFNDKIYNRTLQGLFKLYMGHDNGVEEALENGSKKKKLTKAELKKRDEFIHKVTSYNKDDDPIGLKALEAADPVQEFGKYLTKCTNDWDSTLYMYFKYYLKTEKYVLALAQINKLHKKDQNNKLVYALLAELKLAGKDEKLAKLVDISIAKSFPEFKDVSGERLKEVCIEKIGEVTDDREAFVIIEYLNAVDASDQVAKGKLESIYAQSEPIEVFKLKQLSLI